MSTTNVVIDHDGYIVARNVSLRMLSLNLQAGATMLRPNVCQLPVPTLNHLSADIKRRLFLARTSK